MIVRTEKVAAIHLYRIRYRNGAEKLLCSPAMSKLGRFFSPCSLALIALRTSRGWTQETLANSSRVSISTLISWENGARTLSPESLYLLAMGMGYDRTHVNAALFGLTPVVEAGDIVSPDPPPVELPGAVWRAIRLEAIQQSVSEALERQSRLEAEARARWHAKARAEADGLVRRLLTHPVDQREAALERLAVPGAPRWALIERACAQSQKEGAGDPDAAHAWAVLALHASIDPSEAVGDLLSGYAFAFLGDALRIQGKLERAENAFMWGLVICEDGPDDLVLPLREWWRDELEARLRHEQGRIGQALALRQQALELALPEERATIQRGRAETLLAAGEESAAIEALQLALGDLPEGRDPGLRLDLELRLADLLSRNGRSREAAALLPGARSRAEAQRSAEDLGRILWIQARIDASGSDPAARERARAAYEQLRSTFSGRLQAREAAEVSLELAALLVETGAAVRLRRLLTQMAWITATPGLPPAAYAAIRALQEAPRKERPLAWIRTALAKLRRPPIPEAPRASA
jgi:transcriptional regulator with XRE-family HTH domain